MAKLRLLAIGLLLLLLLRPVALSRENDGSTLRRQSYEKLREGDESKFEGLPVKCGFQLVANAMHARTTLPAEQQKALNVLLTRPVLQKNMVRGNFRIHYDTAGVNEPAVLDPSHNRIPGTAGRFVDSVAALAQVCRTMEMDSLGYPPPLGDGALGGGPEYDIYIVDLGRQYGGTETDGNLIQEGDRSTSYMTIDNDFVFVSPDSNKGLPALRVTLAHEFHHALQLSNYGFWTSETYFYEITSTWMEDVVFPDVNDYFQYLFSRQGQFRAPELSFTESGGITPYSRAIWGHYLDAKYRRTGQDGRLVMRRIWEQVRFMRPLLAIEAALQQPPYSTNLKTALAEWAIWNYFTGENSDTVNYYPEGKSYPTMTRTARNFSPPADAVSGSLPFFSSKYTEVRFDNRVVVLLVSNLNLDAARARDPSQFPFTYVLNTRKVDDTYQSTSAGIFIKLQVPDPGNWLGKDIGASSEIAVPFPNPFGVDGSTVVSFPVSASSSSEGKLFVFSSSMSLVYSSTLTSRRSDLIGKQVFTWNGRKDNGELVATGVYLFVLEFGGQSLKGKIAAVLK